MDQKQLDLQCINTIRFLAVDAVQKANSGHPGSPLGDSVIQYVLWDRHLRHNPENPAWFGRDRYILSAGHASMLQYSIMHLTGYDISLEEIKKFRQWDSKTPGHPEYWHTPGIEMTTGPLGQGFAHGVGMAIAAKMLAEKFNKPGCEIVDNRIYALVSDGDLQEGISYEAASLAGFLGLGNLVYLYMDNDVQIEGSTYLADNENTRLRFESQGWHVIGPIDGMDPEAVDKAIIEAKEETEKPSLVICTTIIGYGSPLENKSDSHGAPLGVENVEKTKKQLGWPLDKEFFVPEEVKDHMGTAVNKGEKLEAGWKERFENYSEEYPQLAKEFEQVISGELPEGWDADLAALLEEMPADNATRSYNGKVLNALAKKLPLVGGSADLGPSIKTIINDSPDIAKESFAGRNLHFGVREHAMGSIIGGIALFGGFIPYCSTFLIFVDYMRPSIRLAALMGIRALYIYSHDSIGVGEDGPTHQPIEQLMNLRGVPNLNVIRPADAAETVEAWKSAISRTDGPTTLIFTRQKVKSIDRSKTASAQLLHKGGYVLAQTGEGDPDLIIIATGSELHIALEAAEKLGRKGSNVRVVSMPCWELFEQQDRQYRESVFPLNVRRRISVEAGLKLGWERYIGCEGIAIGMDSFGRSAPGNVLFEKFNITTEAVLEAANKLLS